ncbi:lysophospholipid acyltransferase family protein [Rarobacter incanus]|uniref:1-acyl-sn-glycerol-3-phosphate acyltransferase n=1 Tax=Rarobacter incanus TaxID=153494 RepID=A0A542SRL5_9MICO|nr:lysophospholipid acyltransferase family protein [Rarobacter incanus]TQK77243.1 1-acyl-sn-glycerol-3-phosphate acyltransferase [Rarobacter incanus]
MSRIKPVRGLTPTYRALVAILRPGLMVFTRRDWHGGSNIPRSGGFIVAANHMSAFDPLTTTHFLFDHAVAPKIMAKDSLWKVPVLGSFLRGSRMIPVSRGTRNSADSLQAAAAALRNGEVILIFPEGTLTKDPDLWPMAGKTGVARLALMADAPVIPLAQWGVQRIFPQHSKFPRLLPRKRVQVAVGPAVGLDDLRGQPLTANVLNEATDRIMRAIADGVGQLRAETPPAQLFDLRATRGGKGTP